MDTILEIVAGVAIAILSGALGALGSKISQMKAALEKEKEEKANEDVAIKEAVKEMLRKSLKDDYEFYTEQGFCSIVDKDEVERIYKIYHEQLHGNGRGTKYYNAVMELPESKQ